MKSYLELPPNSTVHYNSRSEYQYLYEKIERLEKLLKKATVTKPYMTREEVKEMCGISSYSTLHYWKHKNLLVPKCYAGRKPLYKREDVINFIEGKEAKDEI